MARRRRRRSADRPAPRGARAAGDGLSRARRAWHRPCGGARLSGTDVACAASRPVVARRHGPRRPSASATPSLKASGSPCSPITTSTVRPRRRCSAVFSPPSAAMPAVYVPDRRREGYGPSASAFLRLRQDGVALVVTVDCGTAAHEPDRRRRRRRARRYRRRSPPGSGGPAAGDRRRQPEPPG